MTSNHLSKLQALFQIGEHHPIALRALQPGLPPKNFTFSAADYPSIGARWEAFANRAVPLNDAGYNIYTCLNPIRPDFQDKAVRDVHIECRRLLLIDLDRNGTSRDPANDVEIRLAIGVADKIEGWFLDRFNTKPIRVMSGNGIHLYYPMELPNTDASQDYCRNVLKGLAREFDTRAIKVDTAVHNASRITKVPGTIARKGEATVDRPFRRAMFL
jgi:hypothetical protein